MTAKSGQKYMCVVPDPFAKVEEKPEPTVQERMLDYSAKLKNAYGKGCFTKQKDYWIYEVCPFGKVRQYHKEGEQTTMDFSLGTHDPAQDMELSASGTLTQRYVAGSSDRQSLVKYVCNDDLSDSKALLTTIEEPKAYHYVFEIRTNLVCSTKPGEESLERYLQPLANECVSINTGWWTYKFCYGQGLTQFHRENVMVASEDKTQPPQQTVRVTAEFDLGHAPSHPIEIVRGADPKDSYASQWYDKGTTCDIGNKQPRKTEVRYTCDPNEGVAIRQIKESATCEYVLQVATRLLCQHKQFAPEQPKVHEIACSPVEKQMTNELVQTRSVPGSPLPPPSNNAAAAATPAAVAAPPAEPAAAPPP